MEIPRVLYGSVIRIGLVLACFFAVGCHHQQQVAADDKICKQNKPDDCGNKEIKVDPKSGVDPSKSAICVCKDDVVEWKETGNDGKTHQFKVEFTKNGTPFQNQQYVFDNKNPSGSADYFPQIKEFDYTITVDGKSFDPRIVGGGGHPLQ